MKALSLWQPWASLWLTDRKLHETRDWPARYRGPLLVHAAKRFVRDIPHDHPLCEILEDEFGGEWSTALPIGALIGRVDVIACLPGEEIYPTKSIETDDYLCGDFSPGRWAWRRGHVYTVFKQPIPYRGRQRLFDVTEHDILAQIDAQRITQRSP